MKKFLLSIFMLVSVISFAKEINLKNAANKGEIINVPRVEKDIYKIYTSPLHQTLITFGDEVVEYSETGDNIQFFTIDDTNSVRIKAGDENLSTDLIVKTNQDIYYFKVISTANTYNPMINFLYPQKAELKRQRINQTSEPINLLNLDELNTKYSISKKKSWTPTQVFDDGLKTYMIMPDKIQELPAIMLKNDDGGYSIVTFRIKETEYGTKVYIIDRLFKEAVLQLGKNKIIIKNKNYRF